MYVIEYDNVQVFNKPGQNYDFEVVGTRAVDDAPGAYEIVYAYNNLNGPINDATIGVENPDGIQATQYAYNDATPTTLHNGLMICFDYKQLGAAPATLTYQATVDAGSENQTLTNTALHNTDNPGSMQASASADVLIPGNDVNLSPAADAMSAHPTEIVTYTLDLTNTGNISDTIVLSATGNAWNVTLPFTNTVLSAGETTSVLVSVEIPDHTPDGDSDMVTVSATSQGDPSKSASSDLTTISVWYRLLLPWISKAP